MKGFIARGLARVLYGTRYKKVYLLILPCRDKLPHKPHTRVSGYVRSTYYCEGVN